MNKDESRLSNSEQMSSRRKIGEKISLLLLILFVVVFSVRTLESLSGIKPILFGVEHFLIGCFTVEYVVRVWIADNKRAHILSFSGIVDLVAILPFYVSHLLAPEVLTDATVLRILGVTRILVGLKFFRHCKSSIDVFQRAFAKISTDLGVFFAAFVVLLYLSAVAVYWVENTYSGLICPNPKAFCSVFDGLWWAVVTLTTVGYGDFSPVTPVGKIFTFVVLLLGMGMIAIPAALFTTAFKEVRDEDRLQNTVQEQRG